MGECLFISDLHLSPEDPTTVDLFLRFLRERAPQAHSLYILGDLFDAWIGDDDDAHPYPEIIQALGTVSGAGTRLFFQRGNRDFLVGKGFARRTGCRLLSDPAVLDLQGKRILLMHGDLLCTDDVAYQRFRRWSRNPLLKGLFLLRSLDKRRAIAADYRRKSGRATAAKPDEIMDTNQETVESYMRRHRSLFLIHGHTHRPARHEFSLHGHPATRWVLAPWSGERGEALSLSEQGARVEAVVP